MTNLLQLLRFSIGLMTAGALAVACAADHEETEAPNSGGHSAKGGATPAPGGSAGQSSGGTSGTATFACKTAQATPLPERLIVSEGAIAQPTETPVFVQDLFDTYRSHCGACHVDASSGGLKVTAASFPDLIDSKAVDRILSTDETKMMPPAVAGGKLASTRNPGDPVLDFVARLKVWIDAGRPRDVFYVPVDPSTTPVVSGSDYRLTTDLAAAMTNIGNCVPDPHAIGTDKDTMSSLDAKFAAMTRLSPGQGTPLQRIGLPEHLRDTDLTTLESATLAKTGVISYVPNYPLWTDDAGKQRHVRVPVGKSIHYDSTTKTFDVPENTRFYKTFSRQVKEADGVSRSRKVETRVLVTREDVTNSDGTATSKALFGTYVWNDDETDAVLLTDPLRNGEPFRDRLITVITDEVVAAQIEATNPFNLSQALQKAKATRRYAIPGSARCIHCHMGSQSKDFVLGFLPLQMTVRPNGEAGTIESPGPDELTQLKRLIDYGVVSGLNADGSDSPKLEQDQGGRTPRNDFELKAQGYVLGNCAHCHNPRGFPSVENPVLKADLDFLPSDVGGLFQFPLERNSQRIFRGPGGSQPIPYITPSLADVPISPSSTRPYTPKSDISSAWWGNNIRATYKELGLASDIAVPNAIVFAPWRSLIYRNVDTPFTYSDDYALFPHMPMDSPGNDCRAHQILGDWMTSIPAKLKYPTVWEFGIPPSDNCVAANAVNCDDQPQPYVEVKPNEDGYLLATQAVDRRLEMFHTGLPSWIAPWEAPIMSRYQYCPDNSDIVDPAVGAGSNACTIKTVPGSERVTSTVNGVSTLVMPNLGVPNHPHFVITDLTDTPGDYAPRRPDWKDVIIDKKFPTITGADCSTLQGRQQDEKRVVNMLSSVKVTDELRQFALTEIPFGTWKSNPACNLSAVPTVESYKGTNRPKWMDRATAASKVHPSDHVYTQKPGAAIYNMICVNCHGALADSQGRMADNVVTMTGGTVRVANLRGGLFGPVSAPGSNYRSVFSQDAQKLGLSAEDLAARYLSWMALGGTLAQIPPGILNIVGNTQVLGTPRNGLAFASVTPSSANMLAAGQELCRHVLPWQPGHNSVDFLPSEGSIKFGNSALIATNGDQEMWQKLCAIGNPPPIRAVTADDWKSATPVFRITALNGLYRASGYPDSYPVGDDQGNIQPSLTSNNLFPWCILRPSDTALAALADDYVAANPLASGTMPFCPESLVTDAFLMHQDPALGAANHDLEDWATRGAINAGFAVFLYRDQLETAGANPKPSYDRCDLLQ